MAKQDHSEKLGKNTISNIVSPAVFMWWVRPDETEVMLQVDKVRSWVILWSVKQTQTTWEHAKSKNYVFLHSSHTAVTLNPCASKISLRDSSGEGDVIYLCVISVLLLNADKNCLYTSETAPIKQLTFQTVKTRRRGEGGIYRRYWNSRLTNKPA